MKAWRPADLLSMSDLLDITKGIDVICHIGGIGDIYVAAADPALALCVNGLGTLNLLEAAKKREVARFFFASTWEVYGTARYEPIDEDHPCNPSHPYSISKLTGDMLVRSYRSKGQPLTTSLRLGTVYGTRMRQSAVIPKFVLSAIKDRRIEIQGSGDQFRQFTHVKDVARAFGLAIENQDPGPVYNIVSSERTSISDLAVAISERLPAQILHNTAREGDVSPALVSPKLAEKELGWRSRVSLKSGLEEIVAEYASVESRFRVEG